MELDVLYSLPDESTASFTGSQAYDVLDDDQQMLIDIEQNIANLERSITSGKDPWHSSSSDHMKATSKRSTTPTTEKSTRFSDRKRSTLKSVRSLIKFGKQRPPKDDEDEEEKYLIQGGESGRSSRQQSDSESAAVSRVGSQESLVSNADSVASMGVVEKNKKTCR